MYDTDRARVVNVICDADGNYDITDLRKGTYTLTFSRPGFAAAERKVTLPADDSAIVTDVDLTRTIIAGQVVDAAGRSIPRATIRATFRHLKPPAKYPAADRDLPGPVIADDNGNFVFESPVAGAYTLEVSANGFPPYIAEIIPLGTRDLKIVMKMPGQN